MDDDGPVDVLLELVIQLKDELKDRQEQLREIEEILRDKTLASSHPESLPIAFHHGDLRREIRIMQAVGFVPVTAPTAS